MSARNSAKAKSMRANKVAASNRKIVKGWIKDFARAKKKNVGVENKIYGRVQRMPGISPMFFGVHAYTQIYPFTCGALGAFGTEELWNLNSMFDPDQTATGHQPYLRDTYAGLYGRYKVHGIKVEFTCSDPSADGIVIGFRLNAPADTTVLAGSDPNIMGEKPNVALRYINNTGKQVVLYKKYFPMSTILGITKLQFKADTNQYSAATGSNPTSMPQLHVSVAALDGVSTPSVKIMAKFAFYCQWTERLNVAQS